MTTKHKKERTRRVPGKIRARIRKNGRNNFFMLTGEGIDNIINKEHLNEGDYIVMNTKMIFTVDEIVKTKSSFGNYVEIEFQPDWVDSACKFKVVRN